MTTINPSLETNKQPSLDSPDAINHQLLKRPMDELANGEEGLAQDASIEDALGLCTDEVDERTVAEVLTAVDGRLAFAMD